MRRPWLRSPLPLALAITLASIAVGVVVAFITGSLETPAAGESREGPAGVMLLILQLATVELFVLWGAFWLVKRQRSRSTTTTP